MVSAVLVASGAVVLGTTASAKEVRDLEREKLVIEWQQGVERRDAVRATKAALAEHMAPPTLLPEASPAAPHLRGPLRPPAAADAPTR